MRTRITQNAHGDVTVQGSDPHSGEAISWTYYVKGSGYIYFMRGDQRSGNDRQVCEGLGHSGHTLRSTVPALLP